MQIAIVDYQMGNLRSVQKALEQVGFAATVSSDPAQILAADKVVLPGVGGFKDAIRELRTRSLDGPIIESIQAGKPFLGICLGLQMLFELGLESGEHQGLGILKGRVERFPPMEDLKVPHMGWNQVGIDKPDCPLFIGVPTSAYFYFVHSYFVRPEESGVQWLSCEYGQSFCAAIWRENMFATQFHPEKSQENGLKILENFGKL
ncbi:MAG: imidazole glycerol phosphate synthase subunit HisH [Planctomycetota bacterium]